MISETSAALHVLSDTLVCSCGFSYAEWNFGKHVQTFGSNGTDVSDVCSRLEVCQLVSEMPLYVSSNEPRLILFEQEHDAIIFVCFARPDCRRW